MSDFQLKRLGLLMEPEPGNPLEVEGVLNPAVVRGPDGQLYLFPRLVARGNFSRIGIARVRFDEAGAIVYLLRNVITRQSENFSPARLILARYLSLAREFQLGADILGTAVSPR